MKPVVDPESTKYPDRVFYQGGWRTPEQIERRRERRRVENMTPGQVERVRERWRVRRRVENMTPEQVERRREWQRERQRERYRNDFAFWAKQQIKNRRRYSPTTKGD